MSDENTYDDIAGESGAAVVSLSKYIGKMDDGELALLAGELGELLAHPGWHRLMELVAIKRSAIEHGATRRLWSHFKSGQLLRDQTPFIRLSGEVAGLDSPQKIIQTVLKANEIVQERIEAGEAT